ncbi:hypothetical protein [Endozoicomonas sp. SCSIO W0465]|uniref:hypothetical protein n=1 Tax=Endozoicomonas sp. SCSIO W0465 TaxID=2918516 RepID=UPI00207646EC|nr:hypothetical protein [Endozoicomonas sp. SCSIO W0465]USE37856.1 hypothetical protein MJO57_06585 [Endozoicomonas sp. SCSIO W0465]
MRLNLLLTPLQQVIDSMQKGKIFKIPVLMEELDLWEHQNDLQKMRIALAFRSMVENGVLNNIQLLTHHKTRHAVYITI